MGALLIGLALILTVLWEAFETIVLPRRVRRWFRLTRFYYRLTWLPWSGLVRLVRAKQRQASLLSFFGPFSLIGLLAMWATGLVLGFALIQYGLGSHISGAQSLTMDVYFSGTSFFTLGLGDIAPLDLPARFLTVLEAGVGFGF